MDMSGHRIKGQRSATGRGHGFGARYQDGTAQRVLAPQRACAAIWERCPHCGVPACPTNQDEQGVCRYCHDGTDTPF